MELSLRVMGIGEGDEVITTAYTYTATASCICHTGATPVLVDTLPDSFEMDPEKVRAAFTGRIKAVICVDLAGIVYGHYDEILRSQRRRNPCFVRQTSVREHWDVCLSWPMRRMPLGLRAAARPAVKLRISPVFLPRSEEPDDR